MKVREHWGMVIRQHRQSWDLTQGDVARMVGASQGSVTAWERGTRTPDPEMLYKLVKALDIEPRLLFDVDDVEVEIRDVA